MDSLKERNETLVFAFAQLSKHVEEDHHVRLRTHGLIHVLLEHQSCEIHVVSIVLCLLQQGQPNR